MHQIDFDAHNAQVRELWKSYRARQPQRVPTIFGINTRYTMLRPDANPRNITFEQYFADPQVMLERQLEAQNWVRHHVPQDAEMGIPTEGWDVLVDLQNVHEAAWFGCPLHYCEGQVPDTLPILEDDDELRKFLARNFPDPFNDGIMSRNWKFYEYFLNRKEQGFTYFDKPLRNIAVSGMSTDGPLTVACNVRGASQFLLDLVMQPELATELLHYITDATVMRIKTYRKRLGQPEKSPSFGFADDSIQLISTDLYEEMVLPHHKKLVSELSGGEPGGIHLCGDSTRHFRLIRDELNVMSFDTGYPVDFGALRETLGPDVEIQGGPSVPFLQAATADETAQETKRILQSGIMRGGRFILREGNNLAPDIPDENLWAMYETVREYGRYPASCDVSTHITEQLA